MAVFNPGPSYTPFGPFISKNYQLQTTTKGDLAIAATVFGLAIFFGVIATFRSIKQTKFSRRPLHSVYVWMIWLELFSCIAIAIICLLFLMRIIEPSFYFFMAILVLWSIQVQLLLQIIINRIRIILQDRRKGRNLIIGVAVIITLINISVFCIWIPARLQISDRWEHINDIWDRTEKCIYLVIDACLNWYFIHVVKANLVANGLAKYNRLVRFNQRIIVISILMDAMIIGALSIPNGFVYAIFHPLAFLVKLNIEISMANLIRKIALDNCATRNTFLSFASAEGDEPSAHPSSTMHSLTQSIHHKWIVSTLKLPWRKRNTAAPASTEREPKPESGSGSESGILKTSEFSVMSRRISQLSRNIFGSTQNGSAQKLTRVGSKQSGHKNLVAQEEAKKREKSLGVLEEGSRVSGSTGSGIFDEPAIDEIGLGRPEPAIVWADRGAGT